MPRHYEPREPGADPSPAEIPSEVFPDGDGPGPAPLSRIARNAHEGMKHEADETERLEIEMKAARLRLSGALQAVLVERLVRSPHEEVLQAMEVLGIGRPKAERHTARPVPEKERGGSDKTTAEGDGRSRELDMDVLVRARKGLNTTRAASSGRGKRTKRRK